MSWPQRSIFTCYFPANRILNSYGRFHSRALSVSNFQTERRSKTSNLPSSVVLQKRFFSGTGSSVILASTNSPIQTGTLFCDTAPVLAAQDLLLTIKDIPGVTWIQTIVLGTIAIRLFFAFPLSIVQQKSLARLESLQPELKQLVEDLKREVFIATKIYKWNERTANSTFRRSFKKHWRKLVEDHNCHPFRSVSLALLQVPVWICFSSAIRNVVYQVPVPVTEEMTHRWLEMNAEGTYWLDAITMVDPLVFPSVFVVASLANIQMHSLNRAHVPQTTMQKVIPWILRVGVCGIGVLATYVPAAVSMYWATSSIAGLIQNGALMNPKVRKILRIAASPSSKKTIAVT